ncbi:nucleotide sugar dehydrogenase [Anaeromyxobacter dehalogenans 2CP-1]|uniref:UDP-glucose 6-dehydrogenase n=1 Tax=Anaeromyxobacter dehalogenans (strain ATCC BAA-258 / DSM 21875 / 2CP-1) TaxID=455488 RepID=B8JFU2_ANAD2|nr:UDP-glucose/GDP-mannose dehydrogenase family protein [Anaeromyxobacter dehalogenans]ACL64530.1 nucleotide sugar dehydrogenase [Anaeromyxobacter dehalogenans 2CP-1]
MRIAVVGAGYVGLVTGTCLAESGNDVSCVDTDAGKIERLQRGEVPIYEPGLEELVRRNQREGRLRFGTDLAQAVGRAKVVFLAVGTPEGEDGDAELRHVIEAAEEVARAVKHYTVVATKSTVPVGTAGRIQEIMGRRARFEVDVVSNPEFLKEGAALEDFQRPDRVVVGAGSDRARRIMRELYAPFVRTERPILFMEPRSAEMVKYAANAMLATRISFMNDIALLCEKVGADAEQVRRGVGADTRIGYPFLFPGIGYGGSCFPKDVKALLATGRRHGVDLDLLRAVEKTNERQKRHLLSRAVRHFGDLAGRVFGVWGLAFKPRTDDMREAPSVEVIEGLLGKGARVQAYDPVAMERARRRFGERVTFAPGPYEALEGADALFVVTEWSEFRNPDFDRMKALLRAPVVFDGRNVFDPEEMREQGFSYFCVGRTAAGAR